MLARVSDVAEIVNLELGWFYTKKQRPVSSSVFVYVKETELYVVY